MRPIKGNRSKTFFGFLLIALVLLAINTLLPSALGDRGGFSPRGERVVEAGQKAIVAWNGTDEVLILSTDISSSNETEVVEIMPLPSNPAISKGETQSFQKVTDLVNFYFDLTVNRYRPAGYFGYKRDLLGGGYSERITITFQQTIGPHFLTVVRVDYSNDLVLWLSDFLGSRGNDTRLPSGLSQLFESYIKDNVKFFVIDAIDTNSTVRTVEPLVYEFSSSKLYYPLRISSLFSGDTSISLFTLTNNEIHQDSLLGGKFDRRAQFQVKKETLPKISGNLTRLFFTNPHLSYFSYQGPQSSFSNDVLAEQLKTDFDMPAAAIATLNVGMGLTLVLLFAPLGASLPHELPKLATPRRVQLTALIGGLFGTILIVTGFVLPWGIGGFGENGELLMPVNGIYTISRSNAIFGPLYPLLLLAVIPCFTYFLLTGGRSRKTAEAFVAIGALAASWTTASAFILLETMGTGTATTLTGCLFIMIAGLLSMWNMRMAPMNQGGTSHFREYVTRRITISILTIVGITLIVFWLYSQTPWYLRTFF